MNSVPLHMWLRTVVIPNPSPVPPPGAAEKMNMVLSWMYYGGIAVVFAAIILITATIAWENKNGQGGENLKRFIYVLIAAILMGSGSTLLSALLS